jgi:hypothetical protein
VLAGELVDTGADRGLRPAKLAHAENVAARTIPAWSASTSP